MPYTINFFLNKTDIIILIFMNGKVYNQETDFVCRNKLRRNIKK